MHHGFQYMHAVYCAYLLFQLWSHTYLFEDPDKNNRLAVKRPRLHQRLSQFRALEQSGESSTESSPGPRAPVHSCPQCLGYKRTFPSVSDVSLPLASGTSSSLGFVYSRGTATPAPVLGSTVKLVRDSRCTVSSLPSGEELHSAPQVHLCESSNLEQLCDEELGVANASGEKTTTLDAPDEKSRLSWTLTLALLVLVTIVGLSLRLFYPDVLSTLAGCRQRGVPGRIYG
jgi:Ca2+:H+ antiporter